MRDPYASPRFERARELVDRRRLRIGLGVAVAVVLIAAIPGVLTGGGGAKRVRATGVAQGGTPTTLFEDGAVSPELGAPMPTVPPPLTTTTQPVSVLGTSFTQVPTTTTPPKSAGKSAPPGPAPAPPPASSPSPNCHNSYDPACGQFRWDPDPGQNQPITGNVVANQSAPGAKVTFTVNGDDPDAAPLQVCNIDFGDAQNVHCDPRPAIDPSYCPKQYGPWTPPAKNDGPLTNSTSDHQYSPGSYHVVFEVRSAMQDCNNPYASATKFEADIIVT